MALDPDSNSEKALLNKLYPGLLSNVAFANLINYIINIYANDAETIRLEEQRPDSNRAKAFYSRVLEYIKTVLQLKDANELAARINRDLEIRKRLDELTQEEIPNKIIVVPNEINYDENQNQDLLNYLNWLSTFLTELTIAYHHAVFQKNFKDIHQICDFTNNKILPLIKSNQTKAAVIKLLDNYEDKLNALKNEHDFATANAPNGILDQKSIADFSMRSETLKQDLCRKIRTKLKDEPAALSKFEEEIKPIEESDKQLHENFNKAKMVAENTSVKAYSKELDKLLNSSSLSSYISKDIQVLKEFLSDSISSGYSMNNSKEVSNSLSRIISTMTPAEKTKFTGLVDYTERVLIEHGSLQKNSYIIPSERQDIANKKDWTKVIGISTVSDSSNPKTNTNQPVANTVDVLSNMAENIANTVNNEVASQLVSAAISNENGADNKVTDSKPVMNFEYFNPNDSMEDFYDKGLSLFKNFTVPMKEMRDLIENEIMCDEGEPALLKMKDLIKSKYESFSPEEKKMADEFSEIITNQLKNNNSTEFRP